MHEVDEAGAWLPARRGVRSDADSCRRGRLLALAALLAFGALTWQLVPHGIGLSWRECDTQAIARNFLADDFDPLRPRVDWRGNTDGAVECEFPFYQLTIAAFMSLFGPSEVGGRVLALLATLAAGFSLHRLLEMRSGPIGALAGLLTFLTCGSTVLIATRVMPDAFSLALTIASVTTFVRYLGTGSRAALWASMAALMLGGLQKPLALQAGWILFGWTCLLSPRRLRDPQLWLGFVTVVGAVAAWLWHGHQLNQETGLTFGVLAEGDSKFPGLAHLLIPRIHAQLAWTTVQHGFSALGLMAAAALLLRRRLDLSDAVVLVAVVAGLYLSLRYSYHHRMGPHYHVFAAVCGAWLVARVFSGAVPRWAWPVLLIGVAGQGAWRLSVEARARTEMTRSPMLEVAASIRALSLEGELIVVRSEKTRVDELWERRNNFEDPRLLYQASLQGWVVPSDGFDVATLQRLRGQGAALVFDWAGDSACETRDWLEANAEVVLDAPRARLYRLAVEE